MGTPSVKEGVDAVRESVFGAPSSSSRPGVTRPGKTAQDRMPVEKRPRVHEWRARQAAMKGGAR